MGDAIFPFKNQSLVLKIFIIQRINELESHGVRYIDNFVENNITLNGETWTLEVEDPSGAPLYFLKKYAEQNKMKIFSSYYGDRLTFQLAKDEDSLWWGDAQADNNGYRLTVVKELRVPVGKEKKFTLADLDPEVDEISFVTSSSGEKFQSAALKLPDGELNLTIRKQFFWWLAAFINRINFQPRQGICHRWPARGMTWEFSWRDDSNL